MEDQICAILKKKNVNIFSINLMNDEEKNQSLQQQQKLNSVNNIEWCFHRFSNAININFIKVWRNSNPKTTEEQSESNFNPHFDNSKHQHLYSIRTLELRDDIFTKDLSNDFIYYLSQKDHSITQINVTCVSDSKLK